MNIHLLSLVSCIFHIIVKIREAGLACTHDKEGRPYLAFFYLTIWQISYQWLSGFYLWICFQYLNCTILAPGRGDYLGLWRSRLVFPSLLRKLAFESLISWVPSRSISQPEFSLKTSSSGYFYLRHNCLIWMIRSHLWHLKVWLC